MLIAPNFWQGRRVLLTGHTGFKGAWLGLMLHRLGAEITGIALAPGEPALFSMLPWHGADHRLDIRAPGFPAAVRAARPEIVFHLAAQALVGEGYRDPAGSFATNLTGTIALLEALRGSGTKAAVLVTTDKVYRNDGAQLDGTGRPFREDDPLGGHDPYSASKAAAEIAIASWRASFPDLPPLGAARAGNVIGGGDFAPARLIPDIVRSLGGAPLELRYPQATRPWQHVLDVLAGYLLYAEALATKGAPPALNFGPDGSASVTDIIAACEAAFARPLPWRLAPGTPPPEAPALALDSALARQSLGWRPRLDAIAATADWYAAWRRGEDVVALCAAQVDRVISR